MGNVMKSRLAITRLLRKPSWARYTTLSICDLWTRDGTRARQQGGVSLRVQDRRTHTTMLQPTHLSMISGKLRSPSCTPPISDMMSAWSRVLITPPK